MKPLDIPHRRYNPLLDEWILISPHRAKRPWKGAVETVPTETVPAHDPTCYLCPGNTRSSGQTNPDYTGTYVFINDFQAIHEHDQTVSEKIDDLFLTQSVTGACRVMCFSPRHDLTLAHLDVPSITEIIHTWISQEQELGKKYRWVQIFENKGAIMGCSHAHPHCQIWASDFLPDELTKEDIQQKTYFEKHHRPLLVDYLQKEQEMNERIVSENTDWIVIVPYWAVWPFETILMPKDHIPRLVDLSEKQQMSLAQIMKELTVTYDRLFGISFPYSMGWHHAPFQKAEHNYWQLHAHFYPPLLRSATVRKFMVGYEMLAEKQRDITPEIAAAKLRSL